MTNFINITQEPLERSRALFEHASEPHALCFCHAGNAFVAQALFMLLRKHYICRTGIAFLLHKHCIYYTDTALLQQTGTASVAKELHFCCTATAFAAQAVYLLHRQLFCWTNIHYVSHCICCTGAVLAARFCCTGIVFVAHALCFCRTSTALLYLMHGHCSLLRKRCICCTGISFCCAGIPQHRHCILLHRRCILLRRRCNIAAARGG